MRDTVLAALAARNPAAALEAARQWIAAEPGVADAHWALAQAEAAAGRPQAAAAALDAAIAMAPDRADLLTARAYLDLSQQKLGEAEAMLGSALALDPNQLPAYLGLAHLALARGDDAEAKRLAEYAKRIEPDHPRLLLIEAQLAGRQGQQARILPLLTAAVRLAPTDALIHAVLGFAHLEQGHGAFAEQAFRNALRLGSGEQPALRFALADALEAQGRVPEALVEVDAVLSGQPRSERALWQRARLLALLGEHERALDAIDVLLGVAHRHDEAVELELQVRAAQGGLTEALRGLEARIQRDPFHARPWRLMLSVVDPATAPIWVERWRTSTGDSGQALEAAGLLAEATGQRTQAAELCHQALQKDPALVDARLLLARAAMHSPPEQSHAEILDLLAGATDTVHRQALSGWLGMAEHRMGRFAEATEAWRRMWMDGPALGLPLPNPQPSSAARVSAFGGAGLMLWGPPGSRFERVAAILAATDPSRVAKEPLASTGRADGFGALRAKPGSADAGTAERWRDAIVASGRDPVRVIDALPHWDGATHATLHGATLVVVLRDPRDLLLNWMAWGSASGYTFPGPGPAVRWLQLVLEQVLDAERETPGRVRRLDGDLLGRDPAAFGAVLDVTFDLGRDVDPRHVAAAALGPHGLPADFEAGAWRRYAEVLGPVFAALEPIAVRLGYPAR